MANLEQTTFTVSDSGLNRDKVAGPDRSGENGMSFRAQDDTPGRETGHSRFRTLCKKLRDTSWF